MVRNIKELKELVSENTKRHEVDCDLCDELRKCIDEKKPFFAGRFGCTEIYNLRVHELGLWVRYQKAVDQLSNWSGFFPNDTNRLGDFCKEFKSAMAQVDVLHQMGAKGEEYFIRKYCPQNVKFMNNPGCWAEEKPWTRELHGCKVLVVHPFVQTIKRQYYNSREKLFPNIPEMLPEFELITLKAIQTIAGERDDRFDTWFEALKWMKEQIAAIDFDVALIGCGAYGFPLGAFCKDLGKIAVHMGGDLQMQFGIIGGRWDDHEIAKRIVNEYWVRPDETETPKHSQNVEKGCYW